MIYSTYQSKKRLALLTSLDDEVSLLAQKLRIKGEQSIPSFLQAAKTAFQASGAAMYINDDWHLCLPKAEQRLVRDIDNALRLGADRVAINTYAVKNPKPISDAVKNSPDGEHFFINPVTNEVDAVYFDENGDFLGKDRELAISQGDLLAVRSAGAYGFTMSSNYNSRPRAAEVLVDGDKLHLIRAREQWQDLWRGEQVVSD